MRYVRQVTIYFLMSVFALSIPVLAEGPNKDNGEGRVKEEKAVLEEITVTAPRYSTPATPIDTQYGAQYNVVTEEQICHAEAEKSQQTFTRSWLT